MNNGDRIISNFKDMFDSLTQEQKMKYLDDHGFEYQKVEQDSSSITQKAAYSISTAYVVPIGQKKRPSYARRKTALKKYALAKKITKGKEG